MTGTRRRRGRGAAVLVGLLAAGALVWQSSHAAFTATSSNNANTLRAGTVTITDNHVAAILFSAPALAPGATGSTCIGVKYAGSVTPTAIRLYLAGALEANAGSSTYGTWLNDATSEADDNLSMQIQVWDTDLPGDPGYNNCAPTGGGSFVDVAGAAPGTNLQSLINTRKDFATGLPSQWGTITADQWRVFKFTYTFSVSAPNSAQGDGVQFNIVWEAQR